MSIYILLYSANEHIFAIFCKIDRYLFAIGSQLLYVDNDARLFATNVRNIFQIDKQHLNFVGL